MLLRPDDVVLEQVFRAFAGRCVEGLGGAAAETTVVTSSDRLVRRTREYAATRLKVRPASFRMNLSGFRLGAG